MMSKRWKPECCESYYFMDAVGTVNSHTWWDDTADRLYYAIGNCFRSLEEAEAATAKVKALLLSLHEPATDCSQSVTDCKQLPKLTAEVFDRPDCPEWAKSAAVDDDGHAYWYEYLPYTKDRAGMWDKSKNQCQFIGGGYDTTDWRNSLVERPTKLPEWCKVGEWIYTSNEQYLKIVGISIDLKCVEFSNGVKWNVQDVVDEAVPARLRPYNAKEMKALVGKPITLLDGAVCLCTAYSKQNKSVILDSIHWDAQELLGSGYTIDNKPCGKLEHLENGEWVE